MVPNILLSIGVNKNLEVGGSQNYFMEALLMYDISASTLLLWNLRRKVLESGAGRRLHHMENSSAWWRLLRILLLSI